MSSLKNCSLGLLFISFCFDSIAQIWNLQGKAIQKKITLLKKEGVKIKKNKVESEIISFFSSVS